MKHITEINSIKLKDGTIISVNDNVVEKDTNFHHIPFKVQGIFLSNLGYCFYMANNSTGKYFGNSHEVNNYKLYKP